MKRDMIINEGGHGEVGVVISILRTGQTARQSLNLLFMCLPAVPMRSAALTCNLNSTDNCFGAAVLKFSGLRFSCTEPPQNLKTCSVKGMHGLCQQP